MNKRKFTITLIVENKVLLQDEVTFKISEHESKEMRKLKLSRALANAIDDFIKKHCEIKVVEVKER